MRHVYTWMFGLADRLHHRERLVEAPRAPEHHLFIEAQRIVGCCRAQEDLQERIVAHDVDEVNHNHLHKVRERHVHVVHEMIVDHEEFMRTPPASERAALATFSVYVPILPSKLFHHDFKLFVLAVKIRIIWDAQYPFSRVASDTERVALVAQSTGQTIALLPVRRVGLG